MLKNHCSILILILCALTGLLLLLGACAKVKPVTVSQDRYAAETMAAALASGTGGLTDQLEDLCGFLTRDDSTRWDFLQRKYPRSSYTMHKTYDQDTQLWTITINKTLGDSLTIPNATVDRIYRLGFFAAGGEAQQYYITNGDTARTAVFRISYGRGNCVTTRVTDRLDSLSCEWTVTDAEKPHVSVSGSYYRAATDTITGWSKVCTSVHQMQMTLSGLSVPRGFHPYFFQYPSGAATGSFAAINTIITPSQSAGTQVQRTFSLSLGLGGGVLTIGGETFQSDLQNGTVLE